MNIADTGIIVAVLDPRDQHHTWAADTFPGQMPFHVSEPVLTEALFQLDGHSSLFDLIDRGALRLAFTLDSVRARVRELMDKYSDRPMSLADASVVAMSERPGAGRVFTVDRRDFSIYRRAGGRSIPCVFPN